MQISYKKRPLSIWSFVSFILIIYGVVISANGIYYKFHPPTHTGLYYLNPSLWWGLILLMIGILFNWIDLKKSRPDKN